jgi:hypothetical protein
MIPNAECLVRSRQDELLREAERVRVVRMLRAERRKGEVKTKKLRLAWSGRLPRPEGS